MVRIPAKKRKNQVCKQEKLRSIAVKRLDENPRIYLCVGGKDACEISSELQAHPVRAESRVFEQRNRVNCMSAALYSAILAVRGTDCAVKLLLLLE